MLIPHAFQIWINDIYPQTPPCRQIDSTTWMSHLGPQVVSNPYRTNNLVFVLPCFLPMVVVPMNYTATQNLETLKSARDTSTIIPLSSNFSNFSVSPFWWLYSYIYMCVYIYFYIYIYTYNMYSTGAHTYPSVFRLDSRHLCFWKLDL